MKSESRCKNREEKENQDLKKPVLLPIHKDSASTIAHQI